MLELTCLAGLAVLLKVGRAALPYLRAPYIPQADKYVIVTGATDGVGKSFALHLAQKGIPLVLAGRNEAKLNAVHEQLKAFPRAKDTKLLKIDYSDQGLSYRSVEEELEGLGLREGNVSGLINCCGTAVVEKYSDLPWDQIQSIKRVNTSSLEVALKILTSPLVVPNPFLVSVSSATARHPLKYSAVYSATKAYLSSLVAAWQLENPHVRALTVEPWFIKTKLVGFRDSWDTVLPGEVAEGTMNALSSGRSLCAGSFKHELLRQFGYVFQKLSTRTQAQDSYRRASKLKEIRMKRSQKKATPRGEDKPTQPKQ